MGRLFCKELDCEQPEEHEPAPVDLMVFSSLRSYLIWPLGGSMIDYLQSDCTISSGYEG